MSRLGYAAGIFVLAVSVRGFLLSRTPYADFLFGDPIGSGFHSGDEAINVAVALSQTGTFADPFARPTGPTAHVPPSFPWVTSYIFRIAGYGNTGAALRNGVNIIGFGLLYASFPLAASAIGLAAESGGIAGILAAIYPSFRSSEVFRGRDEWAAALVLLWLTVLLFKMFRRTETRLADTVMFGLGWALLLHIQPAMMTVLVVYGAIYLSYRSPIAIAQRLRQSAAVAGIVFLLILPWTLRNHFALGGWMFMRDNFGLELRVSHGDGANPSQQANERATADHGAWICTYHPTCSLAAVDEIKRVGEVRFNRECLRDALAWIAGHRSRAAMLTLARVGVFWADLPSNSSTFVMRLLWSVLAWLGLIRMRKAGYLLQTRLFGSILVFYPLIYYTVQYSNRYVVAICFAIFLPAGFALHQMYLATRSNSRGAA